MLYGRNLRVGWIRADPPGPAAGLVAIHRQRPAPPLGGLASRSMLTMRLTPEAAAAEALVAADFAAVTVAVSAPGVTTADPAEFAALVAVVPPLSCPSNFAVRGSRVPLQSRHSYSAGQQ
jgi:hypothetical protein